MKYKICYAKPVVGFAPDIVVVNEAAPGSIPEHAWANLTQLRAWYPGLHFLGQSSFITRSGLRGVKLPARGTPAGHKIRQAFSLFAGNGTQKWVVTASTPASEGAKYDQALNTSSKTFTLK